MGAVNGSISFLRFKTAPGDKTPQYTRSINARRFQALNPGEDANESAGWVAVEAPFDDENDIEKEQYTFGERIVIVYRQDTWVISKFRLRRETKLRVAKICEEESKSPDEVGRAFVKAVERSVLIDLRRRSTPRTKLVECVWTPERGEMRAFGRGIVVTERVSALFERTFGVRCDLAVPAVRAVELVGEDARLTKALSRTTASNIFKAG